MDPAELPLPNLPFISVHGVMFVSHLWLDTRFIAGFSYCLTVHLVTDLLVCVAEQYLHFQLGNMLGDG